MAYDEVIGRQIALWNTLATNSMVRWRNVANRARSSAYTLGDLFADAREQFVASWDTLNEIMEVPTESMLPTVTIRGPWNALQNVVGQAKVRYRLTYATYYQTQLTRFGGGAPFNVADYTVTDAGDFEGLVSVQLLVNPAAGPAAGPGAQPDIYRGIVSVGLPTMMLGIRPLAWVVVVAEPV